MSLEPVISSLLIDFDDPNATSQEKAYQKQVYTAIKLNMNDLQNYDVIDKFTQCMNIKCKMVLTEKDKEYVFDFEEVQSNPDEFGRQNLEELRKARFNKVLWKCGFCAQNNIINNTEIRFAKNKTRVIEREKSIEKKDPIILIVFDVSGSMEQLIEDSSGKNSNWQHLDKIKETKIYKKIVAEEQKELEQIIKQQFPNAQVPKDSKFKYVDHLKKNKLLMGLTEYLVAKINPSKKGCAGSATTKKINDFCKNDNVKSKTVEVKNKTIGFMFFNSSIMLNCDGQKSKKVLLVDSNEEFKQKIQGFERDIVDFDSFDALFKTGQKFGEGYTNKVTNFDFQTLDFKSISNYTQGQTALGPAIVTALGIVSKHGQGSSIVVVTDGIGNKGIFDHTESWDEGYKLLKMRLEKLKCFMTVLEFRKLADKNKTKEDEFMTGLDKFCQRHNQSVVKKINVLLNDNEKSSNQQATNSLQEIEKKMKSGIDRDNCKFSNEAFLKCQHPSVTFDKNIQDLHGKLFNNKQTVHLIPDFAEKKLNPKDYLHHFMTQIVIKYEDTKTGEQCIFMSYIIQKFIKYSKMKPRDIKSLDNENTFMNIIEYLHNEEQKLSLDNLPLGIIRQTFRKTLCGTAVAQKTFRFPNKMGSGDDDSSYEWMQNMRKFEDQASMKQQMKMEEQKAKRQKAKREMKKQQTAGLGNKTESPVLDVMEERASEKMEKMEETNDIEEDEDYDDEDEYICL